MKKIIALILIIAGFFGIRNYFEEKVINQETIIITPTPASLFETIKLSQTQINDLLKKASSIFDDIQVDLLDGNQIQLELTLSSDMIELIPEKEKKEVETLLKLFQNEKVSCIVSFQDNLNLDLKECKVAGIPIPKTLYQGKIDEFNLHLQELVSKFNIDTVKVNVDQLELSGDLGKILEYLEP